MLLVRAEADVDEQGRAPAGRLFPLRLPARHQPGATASRLVALEVEASSDDGATWRAAPTTFTPAGAGVAGFTSLRITARDADGNSVVQTVIRAYQTR